jgi:hypothetical protein
MESWSSRMARATRCIPSITRRVDERMIGQARSASWIERACSVTERTVGL